MDLLNAGRLLSHLSYQILRQLEELEWRSAPQGQNRRLNVYAIGGDATCGDNRGTLIRQLGKLYDTYQAFYSGEDEYDLVVPLSSATAANKKDENRTSKTSCNHFNYFRTGESCAEEAIWETIRLIWKCFDLANYIAPEFSQQSQVSKSTDILEGISDNYEY